MRHSWLASTGALAVSLIDLTRGDHRCVQAPATDFGAAWLRAVRGQEPAPAFAGTSHTEHGASISDDESIAQATIYIANNAADLTPRQLALLHDPSQNVVYFKASRSCVYYDFDEQDWYEYRLAQAQTVVPRVQASRLLIPVTACISSVYGNGGSISREYAVLLSVTEAVSGTLGIKVSALVLRAILSTGVGPRFSYAGSFSCTVGSGEYAQLLIEPFYIQVPESSRRKVMWDRLRGLVPRGDVWEDFERFNLIAQHRPNHVCAIERQMEKLQCDSLVSHHELDFDSVGSEQARV